MRSAGTRLTEFAPEAEPLELVAHSDLLRQVEEDEGSVAFLATPAETSLQLAEPLLAKGVSVIDLSGAFRLQATEYPIWYGFTHSAPHLLDRARYGLADLLPMPERSGPALIANPGCYATAAILALAPLLKSDLVHGPIYVDGKSGTTGAGKKATERLLFSEVAENLSPYRVGDHQHTPEIERGLALVADRRPEITFVPHLVPMKRGLVVTAYAKARSGVTSQEVESAYAQCYDDAHLVEVRAPDALGSGRYRGHPGCGVGAHLDGRTGSVIAVGALDNLLKGAAAQAIQNLNRLWDLPTETGLWRARR